MNFEIIVMKSKHMEPSMDDSTFTLKISNSVVMIGVMHMKFHVLKIFFNAPVSEGNWENINTTHTFTMMTNPKTEPIILCFYRALYDSFCP